MTRVYLTLISALALAVADPVCAEPLTRLNIRGGPLADALLELSQQAGIELLFDRDLVVGLKGPSIRERLSSEAALKKLLQETPLVIRRSPSGVFVIEPPRPSPLARQDAPVAEVLVIGRRSQNADIRRRETDIQPYRVATGARIREADRDNFDQYFNSRVSSNSTTVPPSLDFFANTNSQINLRGLGPSSTLVLVDGRRMPRFLIGDREYRQADMNPVPLQAVDRVEILSGAAGGIFGFGAEGGVVNVILSSEDEGAQLRASTGITTRGDAWQRQLEARIGFALNDDHTKISISAGMSQADPLRNGQRRYLAQDLRRSSAAAPSLYDNWYANSVNVMTILGAPLTLKSAYGGGSLGSSRTFLPAGQTGDPGAVADDLKQNAGRLNPTAAPGALNSQLGADPETKALLFNIRQDIAGGMEVYLDAVVLRNRGRYRGNLLEGTFSLSARSPFNPFLQNIRVSVPIEGQELYRTASFDSERYTIGVTAPLAFHWRAAADVAVGSAAYDFFESAPELSTTPSANPFGDWKTFQKATAGAVTRSTQHVAITSRFSDLALRLGGPTFKTPGGTSTGTLLAERRIEQASSQSRRSATTSFYGELRAPLTGSTGLVRDLEVQVAARRDVQTDRFKGLAGQPPLTAKFQGTVFTAGAKLSPIQGLTFRGSYATGATPPALGDLIEGPQFKSAVGKADPKRAGDPSYIIPRRTGGSTDLGTIQVSTTSLGGILSLFGPDGPRVTLDYFLIRKSHDVFRLSSSDNVLAQEALWPHRVVRAPLTEADRSRGYTGGQILYLDERADNTAGARYDMVDLRLEGQVPALEGRLRLYGEGTYFLRQRVTTPTNRGTNLVDYLGQPLSVRANLGVGWTRGRLGLGANLQYYGAYRIVTPYQPSDATLLAGIVQGAARVPSQAYLDLHMSWRERLMFAGSRRDLTFDLGLVNVFDKAPPRESGTAINQVVDVGNATPNYSRFGDPRQRRIALSIGAAF